MLLTNCYSPEWGGEYKSDGDFELSRRLRIALCCHFYLAYAIRQGVPRSRVREEESRIRTEVHGCFANLSVMDVRRAFRSRCDVCAVLELVERLAKSQYAQGSCEFILQTRNNEAERAEYDWVWAFHDYELNAKLGRDSRLGVIAAKAIAVMRRIQDIKSLSLQPASVSSVANPVEMDAMTVSDIMQLVRSQIKVLEGSHLRIVE